MILGDKSLISEVVLSQSGSALSSGDSGGYERDPSLV
jgi:hypothetical protein